MVLTSNGTRKRVFIVHGWGGNSKEGWFPWLKKELESRGYEVFVPDMPDTENPRIGAWISYLEKLIGEPDERTYFVGHSIGCQTILRYLEKLPDSKRVGGCVFVAPWFTLMNLEKDEEKVAEPWIKTPIDFIKVNQHTDYFMAIFSDNDDVVPLNNREMFAQKLSAKTILENGKGHFSGGDGITELTSVLSAVLEISS